MDRMTKIQSLLWQSNKLDEERTKIEELLNYCKLALEATREEQKKIHLEMAKLTQNINEKI